MEPPPARRLVLASQSPRRIHLLREARYEFLVEPANIDENSYPPNLLPADVAMRLAHAKASVVSQKYPDDVVLAADTIVAFGDRVIGKPKDAADAKRMIELLTGTTQIVITGLAVVCRATDFYRYTKVMSAVGMKRMTKDEINRYIEKGSWQDKAGGYGIQDPEPIVHCFSGDQTNVIGLPMAKTKSLLAEAGIVPQP